MSEDHRLVAPSAGLFAHHHSCPSASRTSNCALPMPGTADGDAVSRCQVSKRLSWYVLLVDGSSWICGKIHLIARAATWTLLLWSLLFAVCGRY